jgi:hypothetical protein
MDDEEEAAKAFWGTCHRRSHEFQSQFNGIDFVESRLIASNARITLGRRWRIEAELENWKLTAFCHVVSKGPSACYNVVMNI